MLQTNGQMDGWTEGRSGPTIRPDFPKVTQVKKHKYLQTIAKANIYERGSDKRVLRSF